MMDKTFEPIEKKNISWYIDDCVIFANIKEEMYELIKEVFEIMNRTGLYINIEKMELLRDSGLVLEYIIIRHGLRSNPEKVSRIKNAKLPKNLKDLRGFLGSINYLRKYFLNCSKLQEPLTELLRKGVAFKMDDMRVAAFHALEEYISDQVMLHVPAGSEGFVIAYNTSDTGCGAVLLHVQNGEDIPLKFANKSFTQGKKNWETYIKEGYAIRWAIEKFVDYIKINGATIFTDNQSLKWMFDAQNSKAKK